MKIKVGIVGVTGYTGLELLRILSNHPHVEVTYLSSKSFVGKSLKDVYPFELDETVLQDIEVERFEDCDVLFTALPAGVSYELVKDLKNTKVIDLGADFRFDDPSLYEKHYGKKLSNYETCERAYGLTELNREKIKNAKFVGNPGCYPTAVLLATAPLAKNDALGTSEIFVDAKSGVSGAGRKQDESYTFCELNENLKPYNLVDHRHVPEMEEKLEALFKKKINVVFAPHLIPMNRGILCTIYLKTSLSIKEAQELYCEFYKDEFFVHVLPIGTYPATKWCLGTNHVFLSLAKDERTDTLIVVSTLDNLMKGASGQAVQNMNVMFCFEEQTALKFKAVHP
ncbi:MAG: N-acetyl-gamma-glutamyl-phosphate reductase [Pseudothermotoga sp.]|uniref:N-acetyl-gamma-glutamyl-phosphate reductase n=1 Tax=Pseudothermotoga sp. TaxID=2033661 RepID=UPI002583CA96|nr:N-acetyl-gamma-glutamyl-phosphate reductase [Pseudothermotoga sp.]MDI6862876.1 N-acetyl-gamma-glutamyl-phosphate reductase [Pseudothermotoga sp.]